MKLSQFVEDFYVLDNGMVRAFLIKSETEALLIDALFKKDEVLAESRKITDLPLRLLLTHGDRDHSEGACYFQEVYLHPNDFDMLDEKIIKHPLKEGDQLKIASYDFKVIELFGHTKGSIALFDETKGLLISGDSIQKTGPIYMFGAHRSLDDYIKSLAKLLKIKDKVKIILPSHHTYPLDNSYIEKNFCDALELKEGKIKGVKTTTMPCLTYTGSKGTMFYY